MSFTVHNNKAEARYETTVDGHLAVADYLTRPGVVVITHVGVPGALENRGIGSALVKAALDDIRAQGQKVVPQCSFADAYIRRHPEYQDMLA